MGDEMMHFPVDGEGIKNTHGVTEAKPERTPLLGKGSHIEEEGAIGSRGVFPAYRHC
jgi:hypothetical protein